MAGDVAEVMFRAVFDASGALVGIRATKAELQSLGTSAQGLTGQMGGTTQGLQQIVERLDPARKATRQYREDFDALTKAKAAGTITDAEHLALQGKLRNEYDATTRKLRETEGGLVSVAGAARGLIAAFAGATAVRAFGEFLGGALDEAARAELIGAKVEAIIRATGAAAGKSLADIDGYATQMQRLTGVEDDLTRNAEAVMLTFDRLTGPVFNRAQTAAANLSAVLGTDLASASLQVGKALQDVANGSVEGLTMLRRSGITYSQAQLQVIKSLADTGNTAQALGMALDVLDAKVGGAAERMGNTYAGQVSKLKAEWGDFKQSLGEFATASPAAVGQLDNLSVALRGVSRALTEVRQQHPDQAGMLFPSDAPTAMVAGVQVLIGVLAQYEREAEAAEQKTKAWLAANPQIKAQLDAMMRYLGAGTPEPKTNFGPTDEYLAKSGANRVAALEQELALRQQLGKVTTADVARYETAERARIALIQDSLEKQKAEIDLQGKLRGLRTQVTQAASAGYQLEMQQLQQLIDLHLSGVDGLQGEIDAWQDWADKQVAATRATQGNIAAERERLALMEQRRRLQAEIKSGPTVDLTGGFSGADVAKSQAQIQADAVFEAWQQQWKAKQEAWAATLARDAAFLDVWRNAGERWGELATSGLISTLSDAAKSGDLAKGLNDLGSQFGDVMGQALAQQLQLYLFGQRDQRTGMMVGGILSDQMNTQTEWLKNHPAASVGLYGANLAGQYMVGAGQRSANPWESAAGGFVSGLSSGLASGMGWYALIPAVVSAVAAYISTGSDTSGYHAWINASGLSSHGHQYSGSGAAIGGDAAQDAQHFRELQSSYASMNASLREILSSLNQTFVDMSKFTFDVGGDTKDLSGTWQRILQQDLPAAMFDMYKGSIEAGLKALGVGPGMIQELMGNFDTGEFSDALTKLANFITAVSSINDLIGKFTTSAGQLNAELSQGLMGQFVANTRDVDAQLAKLTRGISDMTSEEKATRAGQIAELLGSALNAARQTFQQLVDARASIESGYASMRDSLDYAAAQRLGTPAAIRFATGKLGQAVTGVKTAGDLPQLTQAWADTQKWAQALEDLASTLESFLPQFDQVKQDFKDLAASFTPVNEQLAEFAQSDREAFLAGNASVRSQIASLRQGLDELAPADMLNRLGQIRDLERSRLQENKAYLQQLYNLQTQLTQSINDQVMGWREAEAAKGGSTSHGQWIVDEMKAIWDQLADPNIDPQLAYKLAQKFQSYADKLYGLGSDIQLQTPGGTTESVFAWLEPLMQQLQQLMTSRYGTATGEVQTGNDALIAAIGGLADEITTQRGELADSIAGIRELVDTQLAGAVTAAGSAIDAWQQQIAAWMATEKTALELLLYQLTGVPPTSSWGGTSTRPPRRQIGTGDQTGEGDGSTKPPKEPPITPIPDNFSGALTAGAQSVSQFGTSLDALTGTLGNALDRIDALADAAESAAVVLSNLRASETTSRPMFFSRSA